jgi:hypothetical protein
MSTHIDYYTKYIKYKTKYLQLRNGDEGGNGGLEGGLGGGLSHNLTYLILDNQGLYHDRLRELLNKNGFKEVSKKQVLSSSSKFVDFFWMGQSNEEGNRFDKDLYQIKSTLKTLLWRDKSHTQGKDVITNKQQLYINMNKHFPDICSKHMAKTFLLKNVESLSSLSPAPATTTTDSLTTTDTDSLTTTDTDSPVPTTTTTTATTVTRSNGVYIVKPAGHGACAGVGVTVVTNDRELEEARTTLSRRFKNIIISEYIQNPLLYEGRKCHIRMYILINSEPFSWSFWERGRIITANLPYKKGDWTNKDIHDTHVKSTSRDLYFPEDILPTNKYEHIYQQMELILSAVAEIVKPYVKCYDESKYCCEVFGIDFMITDDYVVKLIEINAEAGYTMKDKDNKKFKAFCNAYFDWFYKESLIPLLFPTTNKHKNEGRVCKNESGISKSDNKVSKSDIIAVKEKTNTVKEKTNTDKINTVKDRTYISALFYDEIFDEIMKKKGWVKKDVNEFPEYVDLIFCVSKSMINSNIKNYKDRNKFYNIKAKLGSFFYNEDYENNKYENSIYNKQNLYFNMKKYFPDVAKKYFAETVDFLSMKTTNNNVYMIKPVNSSGGVDIHVIKNDDELDKVKKILLPKYTQIIASKYITNPLLYDNKKFNIRVNFIILFSKNVTTYYIYLNNFILTAKKNFINDDYNNADIHDSHGKSTAQPTFVEDLDLTEDIIKDIQKQIDYVINFCVEIFKKNILKCYDEFESCFHYYGADFMVTTDYIVKLLEINRRPQFNIKHFHNHPNWNKFLYNFYNWVYDDIIKPFFTNSSSKKVIKSSLERTIIPKTYITNDKEEEIEEEFVKLLDSKGWVRKDINEFPEYVDLFYTRNYKFFYSKLNNKKDYNKIYDIKANIKSLFWRDDSYKKGKDVIANKYQLYKNMKKQFPEIADVHMAKTFNIFGKNRHVYKKGVYIIKPVGKAVGSGEGIEYVSNKKEFEAVVNKYKSGNMYKKIIMSEYIHNLLLYEKKKFHIRVHMLFLNNNGKITWNANLHGRIFCARTNFLDKDYYNLEIHDTHGRYSKRNVYFPEEFNYGKENTEKVLSQMEMILSKVAEIVKPHLKCFSESKNCFEIFGIDFMITKDFTVILIEVNDNYGIPSFPLDNRDDEENNRLWLLHVKEFVKWIYDNGIAPVYE